MSDAVPTQPSHDFARLKTAMRNTWMAGDFGVIAKTIAGSGGDAFASRLAIPVGSKVLDVATGTGNVAIPLARAGCIVTGVDIAPNLLVQARERAAAEGLSIAFDEGDAEQLPYEDSSFDVIVTMFGAMFAPRPERVAAEAARVLKPGGLLAMANWNPGSFTGRMFRTGAAHVPPPPGIVPPVMWGDEATARERLAGQFTDIATELIPMDFDLPMNPAGAVNLFRTFFGPTKMAFERLDETGKAALQADLVALWTSENQAPDPTNHTLILNQYLQVTARRA
jgi:SAM-dependent methyltransferase